MKKFLLLSLFLALSIQQLVAGEIYLLKTKIGDTTFNDILVIENYGKNTFNGSLTVPGVFTSVIEKAKVKFSWAGEVLTFEIQVKENGEQYPVEYRLNRFFDSTGNIYGSLMKDKVEIGSIQGNKIFEERL